MTVLQLVNAVSVQKQDGQETFIGATSLRNRHSMAVVVVYESKRIVQTSTTEIGWLKSRPYED